MEEEGGVFFLARPAAHQGGLLGKQDNFFVPFVCAGFCFRGGQPLHFFSLMMVITSSLTRTLYTSPSQAPSCSEEARK